MDTADKMCVCADVFMCVSDCLNCVCVFVFRINHVEDHVINQNSGMNMDDLRSVSGKELFKNSQYLVHINTHTPVSHTVDKQSFPGG